MEGYEGELVNFYPDGADENGMGRSVPALVIEDFQDGEHKGSGEPMVNLVYVDPEQEEDAYGLHRGVESSVEHIEDARPGSYCWE